MDAGGQEPYLDAFECFLEILGDASVAAEPGERAFCDLSSGQLHEAFCRVRPFDEFQRPSTKFVRRLHELWTGVTSSADTWRKQGNAERIETSSADMRIG